MTFWGRVINQRNPYDHGRHTHDGRLRITKATLCLPSKGQSTNEKVVLLCKKENSAPIRLCVLIPEKVETQNLELEFEWNDEVVISVSGNHNVSLSGYYNGRRTHFKSTEDDSDTLGEDIAETESKESSDYDSDEDDYDSMDNFINDSDPEKLTSSPEPKQKTKGEVSVQLTPKFPDFEIKKRHTNKK